VEPKEKEMNKRSYQNKRKERVDFLKNLTITTPDESVLNETTSGITSNFHPHPLMKEEEEEESKYFLEKITDEYGKAVSKDSYYDVLNIILKRAYDKDYFQEFKRFDIIHY
jgi:hypothetical protein